MNYLLAVALLGPLLPPASAQSDSAVQVDQLKTPVVPFELYEIGRAISVSGDRLAVHQDPYPNETDAVLIFERGPDGTWTETAKLQPDDPEGEPGFGKALSLDGDLLAIGADSDDGAQSINQGTVYLFERDPSGEWLQVKKLRPTPPKQFQRFGYSLDLEGDRLAIGAPAAPFPQYGSSVYVFERTPGSEWQQVADLGPQVLDPLLTPGKHLGYDVDLDGDRLMFTESDDESDFQGAFHYFERAVDAGSGLPLWQLRSTQYAPFPSSQYFARFAEMDGDLAYVGGVLGTDIGIYALGENGDWSYVDSIVAPPLSTGEKVLLEHMTLDEGRLLASNRYAWEGNKAGIAHLFQLDGSGGWSLEQTFEPYDDGVVGIPLFGTSLALSGDQVFIGVPDGGVTPDGSGQVEVYDLEPLSSDTLELSLAEGGSQSLSLDAGFAHGGELFVILGSLGGTTPGFALPGSSGLSLPLAPDAYFQFTLQFPESGLLSPGVGSLNSKGHGDSQLVLPPGFDPVFAGLTVHHAFVAVDPLTLEPTFASNARSLTLLP